MNFNVNTGPPTRFYHRGWFWAGVSFLAGFVIATYLFLGAR